MEIPKSIEKALMRRAKAAYQFMEYDLIITRFIERNDIDCEFVNMRVESLIDPEKVNRITRQNIISK